MRKFRTAVICLAFVPVVALADVVSTAQSAEDSNLRAQMAPAAAPTAPTAGTPAATATKPGEKDPKKKDDKAASGALANAVQARTPEEQANQGGFQLFAVLDHWLGMGTFVDPALYSYLAANLTVQGIYRFRLAQKAFAAAVTARATFEYTLPDNPTGRRIEPADTRISLSAPALLRTPKFGPFSGIALTPNVGLTLPTSFGSINNGLIANLGVGLTASTRVKMFDLQMSAAGSRGFFSRRESGTVARTDGNGQVTRDSLGNAVTLARPGESMAAIVGNNTAWTASVGGQVQWRATDNLLFYVGYTYFYVWRNSVSVDQFSPQTVDNAGNPVAQEASRVDRTSAFFGGSYQLNEHYSVDVGLSTVQMPLVNVNGRWQPRFPWAGIGSWADNTTTAYFTLTAAY